MLTLDSLRRRHHSARPPADQPSRLRP
jgi:hypothetical protein